MDADLGYRLWVEPPRYVIGIEEEVLPLPPLLPEAGEIVTNDDGTRCRMVKANGKLFCVPMVDAKD